MNNKAHTPEGIGSRIIIEPTDSRKRLELEGKGFFVEVASARHLTLRRDYANRTLKTNYSLDFRER